MEPKRRGSLYSVQRAFQPLVEYARAQDKGRKWGSCILRAALFALVRATGGNCNCPLPGTGLTFDHSFYDGRYDRFYDFPFPVPAKGRNQPRKPLSRERAKRQSRVPVTENRDN